MEKFSRKLKKSNIKQFLYTILQTHKIIFAADKWNYILSISVIILLSIIPYLAKYIRANLIDIITNNTKYALGMNTEMINTIILFIFILLGEDIIRSIDTMLEVVRTIKIYNYINLKIIKKLSSLDLSHYDDPDINDQLQKGKESYRWGPLRLYNRTVYTLYSIIKLISGIIIIGLFSPIFILILFIFSFPSLLNGIFFGKRKYHIWNADTKIRREYAWTNTYLEQESFLQEIKLFGLESYLIKKIEKIFNIFRYREEMAEKKRQIYSILTISLSSIGFVITYIMLIQQILNGQLSIGQFTFYTATINIIANNLQSFFTNITKIYEEGLKTIDVFKLLELKPKIKSGKIKLNKKDMPPIIEFKNVSFKYPKSNQYIFKNLNFTIKKGENIAIVGENGAGKSTFVKLLCRFYDVNTGEILINGINIKELDIKNWYKQIATLSQDFTRYHFNALTNIGLGDVDNLKDKKKIIKAAKKSGAHEFIEKFEYGYNQLLNKKFDKGTSPSVGQWQKIALARSYFKDSPILILDEPTSAIDPKAESEIFDKLFKYTEAKSIIIISHRFSTIKNAQRIIVMDKGKIIEQGNHKTLMKLNGKYKDAFELQKQGFDETKIQSIRQKH